MNCSRFRFLIQQWFDAPLSPQDERMVLAHVEQCDSCARFQHQLDQVIQTAPEVPLPDDCLPSNLEALAKRIMDQIPRKKPGFFGMLKDIFSFGGKSTVTPRTKKKAPRPQPAEELSDSYAGANSMFPHVRPRRGDESKAKPATAVDEEMLATSTRLRNFQQRMSSTDEPQAMSQGQSLGSKFGMNVPMREQAGMEDGPLTLAESIRRKVVEEKNTDAQATSGAQNFGQPMGGQQFMPPGGGGGFGEQPGAAQPSGSPFAPPQFGNPAASSGQPMVGQWGAAPNTQASATPWSEQPAAGGQPAAYNEPPMPGVGGDQDWKPTAPGAEWQIAKPQTSAWSTGAQQPGASQPGVDTPNPGWGSSWPDNAKSDDWSRPKQEGQDPAAAQAQGGWDGQTQSGNQGNWSAPAQGQPSGWPGGDQQAAPQTQSSGQTNQSWPPQGDPQSTSGGQGGWGQQTAQNWATQPVQDGGWPASAQGQAPQPDPWATDAANAGGQSNLGAAPGAGRGAAPVQPTADPASAQTGAGPGWGATPAGNWGGTASGAEWGAQQSAPQSSASMGNPFITSSAPPQTPDVARGGEFEAWSEEGEQIQTGMWQAYEMAEPEIGQPRAGAPQPRAAGLPIPRPVGQAPADLPRPDTLGEGAGVAAAASGHNAPSMFDVPIQDRARAQGQDQQSYQQQPYAQQGQGYAQQPPQQAPQGFPPQQYAAQPAAVPAPPPAPGVPGAGQPKHSIMDRLNKVLGDDLAAMAAGAAEGSPAGMQAPPPPPPPPPPPVAPPPAPPAPPTVAPHSAPAAAQSAQQQGLFQLDDRAMDKVFKENLGVVEASTPVGGQGAPVLVPPSPPAPPAHAAPPVQPAYAAPPVQPAYPAPAPQPPMPAAQAPVGQPLGGPRISPVQPRAPQAPQPAAVPAAAAETPSGLLKKLDDRAVDQIYANIGVRGEAAPLQQAPQAPMPPGPPMPPQQGGWAQPPQAPQPPQPPYVAPVPPASAAQQAKGLFTVDDDAMDRIFADLGVKDKGAQEAPRINVKEAVQQIRTLADVPTPPKIEGISKLSRQEMVSEPSLGKINAIGKFLLDQQDLAKIGRLAEQDLSDTKIRVLTHEASDEINRLLEHIATQPGVVGSVIVGHDGILIANSLPKEHDPETIGILSLGIYINTTNSSKKMGHNHLHQLVCRTQMGYLVIADFGGGILVTVSNDVATEKLIPLMRSITQLVAQS